MSSYVYMKVLESSPHRYDRGIRMLSGGRIDQIYRDVAAVVAAPGRRVLDVGCGTGGVSMACAALGAHVVAIDRSEAMLEVARSKTLPEEGGTVEWMELGAVEIEDRFEPESFDAVASCLMFSELSEDEQRYVLRTVLSRLRPGGHLALADEVLPPSMAGRFWFRLGRLPLEAVTYLLTQTSTTAVADLEHLVSSVGFVNVRQQRLGQAFALVSARRNREVP